MVGALLLRGMLVGLAAGVLAFVFLEFAGEPSIDRAIAFETQIDAAKAAADAADRAAKGLPPREEQPEPELVSRSVQAGIGLFTGVLLYSAALGGLFALAYALAYGRIAPEIGPRATSAILAALGIVAVYIVPNLKYPANPPSAGAPETIGARTSLYFAMIAISLAAMIGAGMVRARLQARHGAWNAFVIAAAAYLTVVVIAALALPAVSEVPQAFPAVVLWQFRIASLGAQAIVWGALGIGFGWLTERTAAGRLPWRGGTVHLEHR